MTCVEATPHVNKSRAHTRDVSIVEHCLFEWTIEDFLSKVRSSNSLSSLPFKASDNDESSTQWQIDLKVTGYRNESIHIDLTRLQSKNTSEVFVCFNWGILDSDGNKVFPGSIPSYAKPSDWLSSRFVQTGILLEDESRFLLGGNLRVSCEMTVYGTEIEGKISSLVRGGVPYGLCVLSDDMEELFLKEHTSDLCINASDGRMYCHKAILSARSRVFAELIRTQLSGEYHLNLGELKVDVLLALLMHMYRGNIEMYLKHTIPKDLYVEAQKYGLVDLQQHLDYVNSDGLTALKNIDVTWELPFFSILMSQPKVVLYCPEPNSSTLYDNRWCFKFEFDSSSDSVAISVVRKQEESFIHTVKFVIRSKSCQNTALERIAYLKFQKDGVQGMNILKNELKSLVSFEDTLVLKCSLKVLTCVYPYSLLRGESGISYVKELFRNHAVVSLSKLSDDLHHLYDSGIFSDAVAKTKIGEINYHSCLAGVRISISDKDLKAFLENLSPTLVKSFFRFLYGGETTRKQAFDIQLYAQECASKNIDTQKIVDKFSDFLVFSEEMREPNGETQHIAKSNSLPDDSSMK